MTTLQGSCLCGNVTLAMPDEFAYMGNCHCSECRKFTGSDYSSAGGIEAVKVRVVTGEEDISVYTKSENTQLAFCRHCGSSLYSLKPKTGMMNIRLGVLDSIPSNKPSFHIFVADKAPWFDIYDELTQFAQSPGK